MNSTLNHHHSFPSQVQASAQRKAYLHVVFPLFITSIIAYLDRVNLSYANEQITKALKFDAEVFGLGAGIFFAGYVLFEIPGALIAERTSPRWWIARIMFSWGILSGLTAFVKTENQFYLIRFLLGAAEASLYPVLYASCIPRWFRAEDRPRAIAVLLTSLQVSSIVGAPLAGWLLGLSFGPLEGWQVLFLLEALPAVLFAIILVFWIADTPQQARWLTADERAFLVDQFERERASRASDPHYTVWQALADPEVLKLSAIYFLWITGFWGFNYWMPDVLKAASGWSDWQLGWMIVPPMTISLLAMLWIGHHSSLTGEKRWHGATGLFVGALGLFCGTLTRDPILAYVCLCVAAIGVYAPFGVWWSYPTSFLTGTAAAGAVGLINSAGNTGGFVGPYLTGFLKARTGSHQAAWLYLAFSLTAAGLLMLTCRKSTQSRA